MEDTYEIPIFVSIQKGELIQSIHSNYYKLVYIGSGIQKVRINQEERQLVGAHLICLNEKDDFSFIGDPIDTIRILT